MAVRAGARMGGADAAAMERLTVYGRALGLAFQIVDDVLDITADLQTLGKDPGRDREAGKTTFVDLLGVDGARARAKSVMDEGIRALEPFGANAEALRALGALHRRARSLALAAIFVVVPLTSWSAAQTRSNFTPDRR